MLALFLWVFAFTANAGELSFTDLHVSADNGVRMEWSVSSSSWSTIEGLSRMGMFPTVTVQVRSGGMDKTQYVSINQMTGSAQIASGTWPPGLTATVKLGEGYGKFDRLKTPHGSGSSVRVSVAGGVAGSQPIQQPEARSHSSSSSSSSFESAYSQPQAGYTGAGSAEAEAEASWQAVYDAQNAAAAEYEARQAAEYAAIMEAARIEQQRIWEEQQRRAAEIRRHIDTILADGSHPLNIACSTGFSMDGDLMRKCVRLMWYRNVGAIEAAGCSRMAPLGLRDECIETVSKRPFNTGNAVHACVDRFGPETPSMRCVNTTEEYTYDAGRNIHICRDGYPEDDRTALRCVSRMATVNWNPQGVIETCKERFPVESWACVGVAVRAHQPQLGLIGACADLFPDEEDGRDCIHELKKRPGDVAGSVAACGQLFSETKEQLECVDRAAGDPDPVRIGACSVEEKEKKRLRCVEGD